MVDIEEWHDKKYHPHNIIVGDTDICSKCKLNLWSESFPQYCDGETTYLNFKKIEVNDLLCSVSAKLRHLHGVAEIKISSSGALSDIISLSLSKESLENLIENLRDIKDNL